MPRTTVKGGEVGAVDTDWEGASGLELLFLPRLDGGWLETAEVVVCSILVTHDKTDVVGRGDGLTSKVLDLKGGSHWLTGAWSGIRESDALSEGGVGEDGELRPVTSTSWCWHRILRLGPSYPLVEGAADACLICTTFSRNKLPVINMGCTRCKAINRIKASVGISSARTSNCRAKITEVDWLRTIIFNREANPC